MNGMGAAALEAELAAKRVIAAAIRVALRNPEPYDGDIRRLWAPASTMFGYLRDTTARRTRPLTRSGVPREDGRRPASSRRRTTG